MNSMLRLRHFFLICSGAHLPLLRRAPAETNKYAGIGATIFFTGLFAAIAAGYALWTVFQNPWAAIGFALLWGLMIFNLDRYIVSSLKKRDRFGKELWMALPRLILAVMIAVVISKPLELKIFEREILAELTLMEQEQRQAEDSLIRGAFTNRKAELASRMTALQSQISFQTARVDTLQLRAQQEADGTGGSRVKNLGPIYKAKKADADSAAAALQMLQTQRAALAADIKAEDDSLSSRISALERHKPDGMASRLEALGRITKKAPHPMGQLVHHATIHRPGNCTGIR